MSLNELEKIKNEFSRLGLHPTYLEHEPVITSEDAAKTRGFELRQGIKSLLFTDGKNNWVVVDVSADRKADQKKIASKMGWSKGSTRMATQEEVKNITGCEIGSVPPFGHKTPVPILVDINVFDNTESAFNIGLRTNSVKILTAEMRNLFRKIGATEGDFIKL
jgi:prolyl-tRNA editing enzyme YbaK/EbsC (Cys-tRNA(Pro) deacylase)